MRKLRVGGNQVGYGFRLGQIEGTMQEGPLGEFAGLRQPSPAPREKQQQFLHDIVGAVATDFHYILAGVGVRPPK